MLYVFYGEDEYSRTQALEAVKKHAGDPAMLAANTAVLEGPHVSPDELRAVVSTVPFLAEKRLVVVTGLLGRFEDERKPRTRKKAAGQKEKPPDYQLFAEILAATPPSTIAVLTDGKVKDSNPLLKLLVPAGEVKAFPLLREPQLRKWIETEVARRQSTITPEAVALLAKLVGGNLWVMAGEIDKLTLYALERPIQAEDVTRLVSLAQEASVFTLVDAVMEFNASRAEGLLERLLQEGSSPAYLMAMLARQLRLVVQTKAMIARRDGEAEIRTRLGVAEFALRRTLEQARRYPLERFKEVYRQLLETDIAIKTGRYDAALALNLLIADLCAPSAPARAR